MLPGGICGEYSLTVSPAPLPRLREGPGGGRSAGTAGASGAPLPLSPASGGEGPHEQAAPLYLTPIRLISHSSSTPDVSLTRRRTSSPSASMSAAVALPRLIRKLQCISDTCASPMTRPRQPAASISCQAFWPGGFLKVEPPVRLLIGCVASRDLGDLVHLGGDLRRVAGPALEQRLGEDHVLRRAAVAIAVVHVGVGEDA